VEAIQPTFCSALTLLLAEQWPTTRWPETKGIVGGRITMATERLQLAQPMTLV